MIIRIIILMLLVLQSFTLKAADLNDCLKLAVDNDPYLTGAHEKILSAAAQNNADISSMFPQITASGEIDNTNNYTQGKIGLQALIDLPKILSFYPLISRDRLEMEKLAYESEKNDLKTSVSAFYYRLYTLNIREKYSDELIAYLKKHIDNMNEMKTSGVDVDFDILKAKMQLASISISGSDNENEINKALISINSITGKRYKISDFDFADVPLVNTNTAYFVSLQDKILDNIEKSFTVMLANANMKIAAEMDRQSIFNFAPSIQAGITYNDYNSNVMINDCMAFISASLPVFDFGKMWSENGAIDRDYLAQKKYYEGTKRDYISHVKLLVSDLISSAKISQEALNEVDAGEKIISVGDREYMRGRIKGTDIFDGVTQFSDALDKYYSALYGYFTEKSQLDVLREETLVYEKNN